VLQVIYRFPPDALPAYVGQQVVVFIEAEPLDPALRATESTPARPGRGERIWAMKLEARSSRAPAAIRRPGARAGACSAAVGPTLGLQSGSGPRGAELKLPEGWSQGAELGAAATPNAAAAPAVFRRPPRLVESVNDPTLDALIERARQSNLDLRVARARLREARAERGIAMASGLPAVDASGQYSARPPQ
jgi:hypothetical protein